MPRRRNPARVTKLVTAQTESSVRSSERPTAQGKKRVSVAALACARPGERARLIYRTHIDRGYGKHRRKGFTETDYARLLDAAHPQLNNLPWTASPLRRE